MKVDEVSNTVVGTTATRLNGDLATCGTQECNLGNVMADAMLFDHGMEDWTGVNIAMTTSGSIASSVEAGGPGVVLWYMLLLRSTPIGLLKVTSTQN